jgi:hypothetical protein
MEVDEEMDEEELAEWRTIFNLFDVDGDESITGEVKVHHLKIIPIRNISYLTHAFLSMLQSSGSAKTKRLLNNSYGMSTCYKSTESSAFTVISVILIYSEVCYLILLPNRVNQRKRHGYLIIAMECLFVTNQPIVQPSQ